MNIKCRKKASATQARRPPCPTPPYHEIIQNIHRSCFIFHQGIVYYPLTLLAHGILHDKTMTYEILKARREKNNLDKKVHVVQTTRLAAKRLEATIIGPRGRGVETGPHTVVIVQRLTIEEALQIQDFVLGNKQLTRQEIVQALRGQFQFLE